MESTTFFDLCRVNLVYLPVRLTTMLLRGNIFTRIFIIWKNCSWLLIIHLWSLLILALLFLCRYLNAGLFLPRNRITSAFSYLLIFLVAILDEKKNIHTICFLKSAYIFVRKVSINKIFKNAKTNDSIIFF